MPEISISDGAVCTAETHCDLMPVFIMDGNAALELEPDEISVSLFSSKFTFL